MRDYLPIILLGLGGFLVGGAYSTWKNNRFVAAVLGVLAITAIAGGVGWLVWG